MVKNVTLKAAKREEKKVAHLRTSGLIPAIVYSAGKEPEQLQVKALDVEKIYAQGYEAALVDLETDGKTTKVIIRDMQKNPVTGHFTHIDFYKVDMEKEVRINVPLHFVNDSPGVKERALILNVNRESLDVFCLPGNIVDSIDVDLSGLKEVDDAISIGGLNIPHGIRPAGEQNELIVSLIAPKIQAPEPVAAVEEKTEEGGEKTEEEKAKDGGK